MTKRILNSMCIIITITLFLFGGLISGVLYNKLSTNQISELKSMCQILAQAYNTGGDDYVKNIKTDNYRITLISNNGDVIYDNHMPSQDMENHLDRAEIIDAINNGEGFSKRYSSTLTQRSIYYAIRLDDSSILRLSITQNTIYKLLITIIPSLVFSLIIAIFLTYLIAKHLTKSIITPLNSLDLDNPLSNKGYDEISLLLNRMDSQQKKLKTQSKKLQTKKDELNTIIQCMNEGLVLINASGKIVSINKAAEQILKIYKGSIGENFYSLNCKEKFKTILHTSIGGKPIDELIETNNTIYQINASPVYSRNKVVGVAMLFLDVTQKEKTEQMRKEFTANVSHELKTPLHSIAGYSELMARGMVNDNDYPMFSNKIYNEAKRMTQLIEDIIELSHLDEGATDMNKTGVDLYSLAQEVTTGLSDRAKNSNISITLTGTTQIVNGIPQLLKGIIYNLCDNAIKYNRPNGEVMVEVKSDNENVILSVKDTGIGIPKEHINRIFERFYCVDKSHSKEVGGTGLGLSIVKHAAKIHNATIKCKSKPDIGTTISIAFPKA